MKVKIKGYFIGDDFTDKLRRADTLDEIELMSSLWPNEVRFYDDCFVALTLEAIDRGATWESQHYREVEMELELALTDPREGVRKYAEEYFKRMEKE